MTAKRKNSQKKDNLLDQAVERFDDMLENEKVKDVQKAYQQIWQAGLGAYAKSTSAVNDAAKESGDEGEKFFKRLVKDGAKLEKKAKKELEQLRDKVEDRVDEVTDKASKSVSKLESAFDKRVDQAYRRLGLPTMTEMEALAVRVAKLEKILATKTATGRKVATKKPTVKKPTARKTPAKKVAAKKKAAPKKPSPKKASTRKAAPKKSTARKTPTKKA